MPEAPPPPPPEYYGIFKVLPINVAGPLEPVVVRVIFGAIFMFDAILIIFK